MSVRRSWANGRSEPRPASANPPPPSRPEPGPGRPGRSGPPQRDPLPGSGPRAGRPAPEPAGPDLRVVLVSRDNMLAGALRSLLVAPGGVRMLDWHSQELDAAVRHADVVIIDMPPSFHGRTFAVIGGRFLGRTVVLLQEGEPAEALPPGPPRVVLYRPLQIGELWGAVTGAIPPTPAPSEAQEVEAEQEPGEEAAEPRPEELEESEELRQTDEVTGEPERVPAAPADAQEPEPVSERGVEVASTAVEEPEAEAALEREAAGELPAGEAGAAAAEAPAEGLPVAESGRLIGLSGRELEPVIGPGQVAPGMDEATLERLHRWRSLARQPPDQTARAPRQRRAGARKARGDRAAARRTARAEAKAAKAAEAEARREQARQAKAAEAEARQAAREAERQERAAKAQAREAARAAARQAEAEAREAARAEARRKAEAEAEAREAARAEARRKEAAEAEAREAAQAEARRKAAAEAEARAEARRKEQEEAKAREAAQEAARAEARRVAAEEAEARKGAREEARRKAAAEEEARQAARAEARREKAAAAEARRAETARLDAERAEARRVARAEAAQAKAERAEARKTARAEARQARAARAETRRAERAEARRVRAERTRARREQARQARTVKAEQRKAARAEARQARAARAEQRKAALAEARRARAVKAGERKAARAEARQARAAEAGRRKVARNEARRTRAAQAAVRREETKQARAARVEARRVARAEARRARVAQVEQWRAARAEARQTKAAQAEARRVARAETQRARTAQREETRAARAVRRQEAARARTTRREEWARRMGEARRGAGARAGAGLVGVGRGVRTGARAGVGLGRGLGARVGVLARPVFLVLVLAAVGLAAAGWRAGGGPDTLAGEVAVVRAGGSADGGLVAQDPRIGPIEPVHALVAGIWLRASEAGDSIEAAVRAARIPSRWSLAAAVALTALLSLLLMRVGPGSGAAAGPGPAPPQRAGWRLGVAALAGALVALDPLLVRGGRAATGTVLALALALGSLALAWALPPRPILRWLPAVGAAGGLALLVSPLALPVLVVPTAAALLEGRYQEAWRTTAALALAVGVWLALPAWVAGQDLGAGQAGWLLGRPPGRGSLPASLAVSPLSWLLVAAGLVAAILTWRLRSGARPAGDATPAARLFAWVAVTAAGAAAAMGLGYPVDRALPFAVPAAAVAVALAAGTAVAAAGTASARRAALAGAGVMLAGLLVAQGVDWGSRYRETADDGLGRLVASVTAQALACSAVNAAGPEDRARMLAAGVTVTDFASGPAAHAAGVRYFVLTGDGGGGPGAPALDAWVRQRGTRLAGHPSRTLPRVELWRVDAGPLDPVADNLPVAGGIFSNVSGSACGGYRVVDRPEGAFHTAYVAAGGKAVLGRPLGSVWTSDGPALQAFDTMVLGAAPAAAGDRPAVRPIELPPLLAKLNAEAVADAEIPLPSARPPATDRQARALLGDRVIGRAYLGADPAAASAEDWRRARERFGRPLGRPQMMPDGAVRQTFERVVLELPADGGPVRPAALGRLAVRLGLVPRQATRLEPVPGLPAGPAETRLHTGPLVRWVAALTAALVLVSGLAALAAWRGRAGRSGGNRPGG